MISARQDRDDFRPLTSPPLGRRGRTAGCTDRGGDVQPARLEAHFLTGAPQEYAGRNSAAEKTPQQISKVSAQRSSQERALHRLVVCLRHRGESSSCRECCSGASKRHARSNATSCRAVQDFAVQNSDWSARRCGRSRQPSNWRLASDAPCGQRLTRYPANTIRPRSQFSPFSTRSRHVGSRSAA